jgi:hypothetical protein
MRMSRARRARAEAEATLGPIELMRGDAEIEQHAVDSDPSLFVSDLLEVTKRSLHETDAVAKGGESLAGLADRVGIDVEADQDSVGRGALEDRLGVTAAAERAVDDQGRAPGFRSSCSSVSSRRTGTW